MIKTSMSAYDVWSAVLAMSLCAFALVASEFLPVSLLTPIAHGLSLTEGEAGQAISVSGFFAVFTSLFISTATAKFERKRVLLSLTGLMMASGFLVAYAPNYATLMVGRAILGVSIGGYWSMSTAVMMRFVPSGSIPKAIAVLQGGSALATAVAAPLGSFIGGMIGWRGAFFCVVPLAAVAFCWQAYALPAIPNKSKTSVESGVFRLLGKRRVAVGMAAVAFLFMGQFALFTYLRPFLETETHVSVSALSAILLIIGVSGLVGTTFVGSLLKRSLHGVMIAIPLFMAALAGSLVLFGSSVAITAALLAAWGLIATAAPVGWFTWLSNELPEEAEAGGGLMVAIIQLAITSGATIGGRLFDAQGYESTFQASAVMLIIAAILAFAVFRLDLTGEAKEIKL
jgi:predicted MFS family arabinose efflux permease